MTLPGDVLSDLAAMPDRLEGAFRRVPAELQSWEPHSWEGIPGERFSPLGQVCHVRDIELEGYQVRIGRMLAEANPALVSLDGYELAARRGYRNADPREALDAFRKARESTLHVLKGLTPAELGRRGTFAEYGEITLSSLVYYLASHDLQHLACLDWLLAKIHARPDS